MSKLLYANGDSFVFGMECIASTDKSEENKMYAFPKHVSDHLNAETYINMHNENISTLSTTIFFEDNDIKDRNINKITKYHYKDCLVRINHLLEPNK